MRYCLLWLGLRALVDWLEVKLIELFSAETAYKINKVEKQKELTKLIWKTATIYQDQTLF